MAVGFLAIAMMGLILAVAMVVVQQISRSESRLVEAVEVGFRIIEDSLEQATQRFNQADERIGRRLDRIEVRLDRLDARLDVHLRDVHGIRPP